jgi:hypothetical protein
MGRHFAALDESGCDLRDILPRRATSVTRRRKGLSLFRITRRIIARIFPVDVLSTRFVRWLFLSPLVANDALLR